MDLLRAGPGGVVLLRPKVAQAAQWARTNEALCVFVFATFAPFKS